MFEVIAFGRFATTSEYKGNDWVKALRAYAHMSGQGVHTIIWEGESPVREFHPELGHTGSSPNINAVCS